MKEHYHVKDDNYYLCICSSFAMFPVYTIFMSVSMETKGVSKWLQTFEQ